MEDSLRVLSIKYVIAIGLVLPILYYLMFFKAPNELKLITDYEQQLVELDGEIKRLDREIYEGDQVKIELENAKKEMKSLSSFFEDKPNAKTIEQVISEEARATGISFNSLQATDQRYAYQTPEEQINPVKEYIGRDIIEANFTGTFTELMMFLSYLSRTDKIVSLKKIELRTNVTNVRSGKGTMLTFRADFETYKLLKDVNAENLAPVPATEEIIVE